MTRVCHMTSAHPPGDIRILYKECSSLARAGYEVYLVEQGDSYEENGVHIVGVGPVNGGRLERITHVAKKVYETALALDADIYHFHDPELLPYGLKLKRQGKKVVFDSHEKYSEQLRNKPYLPHWASEQVANVYTAYEKRALKKLDAVIFPCMQNGKHPFSGLCRRTVTVDNMPMLYELYERYDPSVQKRERSICHVGSLTYPRGITHMIRAAALADCTAYVGGVFSPSEYEAEVRSMPEFSCVEYLGKLNRTQVVELLRSCQIGMANLLNVGQYNRFDNFPTKVYEYMSLGLPVILSRSDYGDRVLEQYRFGISVDPENVEEIADAIRYLLDHPDEARQMGENGRRAVKEQYNWGVEEKKLLALYEDILNDR